MADSDSWDAENFEPNEPIKSLGLQDKWEGEDEEDDVKDNWDDEAEQQVHKTKTEVTAPAKKKLTTKLKEKENEKEKNQEALKKRLQQSQTEVQLTPEKQAAEKLCLQKLQEESDMALACEAFAKGTKKKKKNILAGGGLKAKLKDELDYGDLDGGYNDYEDFM